MTARHSRIILALASAFACAALLPAMAHADPAAAPTPAADAAQQPFYGLINQDNVYLRSGPSDVFYATAKLNKGAKITVVATRDPWLKIVPPEGSYCYVARAYVEKRGDGTVGRVTKNDLNVRAGSSLNGLKTTVLLQIEGAAHYLPAYAGNLDIMTSAALVTAEKVAARLGAEYLGEGAFA